MDKYKIKCLECKKLFTDNYTNICKNHENSFVRTEYRNKKFQTSKFSGLWKYIKWLPVHKKLDFSSDVLTYKSTGLAKELGFKNLYISTCGYVPEKGILNKTGTFKELEALPTIQRAKEHNKKLILATAGNTGRAFAHASLITNFPLLIVIPKNSRLWLPDLGFENKSVKVVQIEKDYTYACWLASAIDFLEGYVQEGGARNVARRDGMGIVLLDAVRTIKKIPDYYFQAIGSGTGAISVWEASIRLIFDGRFGSKSPELHLSQNSPFTPIYDAWRQGKTEVDTLGMEKAKPLIEKVKATMLTNRKPPYSIKGGLYEALTETNGSVYAISNNEATEAQKIFEEVEEYDISPEAGVAVHSLIKAKQQNKIDPKKGIFLLNITGAGYNRLKEDFSTFDLKPDIIFKDKKISKEDLEKQVKELIQ